MPYENGMFASDWIIIKQDYIDEALRKLKIFFRDYCLKYRNENFETAQWDNDDYFLNAVNKMSDPRDYFGLNF